MRFALRVRRWVGERHEWLAETTSLRKLDYQPVSEACWGRSPLQRNRCRAAWRSETHVVQRDDTKFDNDVDYRAGRMNRDDASKGRAAGCSGKPPADAEMLTVTEFATFARVGEWTVYEAIKRDEIPGVVRIGRLIRIHRETAMRWITGE